MRQKWKSLVIALLMILGLGRTSVHATAFLQLESTYLGDGWFEYQMNVFNDPAFSAVDLSMQISFTNQIDQSTTSTNWINSSGNSSYSAWSFANGSPARPYAETFLIRSSDTAYKLGTNFGGAMAVVSLYFSVCDFFTDAGGVFSQNVVGYATMPCLVPCTPEEADNSPTNYVTVLKLLPDVNVNQLIQTNGNIYGVDFTWDGESTFLLQGASDLNNWTNIAYVWSWPPETVWTTNTPLNDYGNFFRVQLVALTHSTHLPPLNSTNNVALSPNVVAKNNTFSPHVTNCQLSNGTVSVSVATQPGMMVQVQAMDSHHTTLQTRQAVAKGTSATVSFDTASLPSSVFFQTSLVP